jgi:serine/threonine-protein kinase
MIRTLRTDQPRRKHRFFWFVLLGMITAFVVAILLINLILLPWRVNIGREAAVPNLIGMTREEGEKELKSRGFAIGDARYVADTLRPAGRLVGTSPRAGTRVKVGRTVMLEISAGQERTQVPQVFRLPVRRAQAAIENAGLRLGEVTTVSSTRIPEGQVITTEPAAGSRVNKGTAVSVTVSLGSLGVIEMPRLKGLSLDRARDVALNSGLVLANPIQQLSPEPAGTILGQDPPEGAEVELGDTVRITVSKSGAPAPETGPGRKAGSDKSKPKKPGPAGPKPPGKTK